MTRGARYGFRRRLCVYALAGTLVACAWPRDRWMVETGWPLTAMNRFPYRFTGWLTREESEAIYEEAWQSGEIGIMGEAEEAYCGWHCFHPRYGTIVCFSLYGILGNALLAFCGTLAIVGTVYGVRRRLDSRWRPGHCPACGYDLRGSVSENCSECGAPIAPDRVQSE